MQRLLITSILLVQAVSASDAYTSTPDVVFGTAFDAGVSTKQLSELSLRLMSIQGGELSLQITGVSPEVRTTIYLRPGATTETWMPAGQADFGSSPLLIATAGKEKLQSYPLPGASPAATALAGETANRLLGDFPGTVFVTGESLPRYAPAYAQILALVVDRNILTGLDETRLRALLEFVGNCGRMMLIDATDETKQIFSSRAACGGRFLMTSEIDTARAVLRELLAVPGVQLPSQNLLRPLLDHSGRPGRSLQQLGFFLAGYLLVFTILIALPKTRSASLAFCIISVPLALLIWRPDTEHSFVAWAETNNDDRIARYAGLEGFTSTGRGNIDLPPDSFGSYPVQIIGENTYLQWAEPADDRRLHWRAALLSQMYLNTRGSFPADPNLRAQANGKNARVCNHGSAITRPALLYWQGSAYSIPSLESGATWSSEQEPALIGMAAQAPEVRLLKMRSSTTSLALLQSLPISDGGDRDKAWLLRLESPQAKAKPCNG